MNPFEKLLLATSYVTSLRILDTSKYEGRPDSFNGLSKYLPSVGLILGLLLVAAFWLLGRLHVNSLLTSGLLVAAWLWLTGALHMDGLMDTADGVCSHQSTERVLEIMRDSRVGNFAVLVAITAFAVKLLSVNSLAGRALCLALVLVPALARACEVYAIGRFSYARASGKGKVWHDTTTHPRDFLVSLIPVILVSIPCCLIVSPRLVLVLWSGTLIGGMLAGHWLNAKIGGHTGDTYGAVVEAAELFGVVAAALWGHP